MKHFHWDKRYLYWGVTAFLVIAASLLFYFGIFHMDELLKGLAHLKNILMPVICGAAIAYLLSPIVNFFEHKVFFFLFKKKQWNLTKRIKRIIRYVSVFLALFLGLSVIYALIAMIVPSIVESIISIINNFPRYLENVERGIETLLENNPDLESTAFAILDKTSAKVEDFLTQNVMPQMRNLLSQLSAGVFDVLNFLKDFLIGLIISVYLMADKEGFIAQGKMFLYSVLDTETANHTIRNLRFVNKTFGGFISGKLIDSLIIGILCYIGTSIIGTPYAVLVSVVVGVTNVIPFFGPYLGAVPTAFLILMVSPIHCLYFALFILVLQQFDGNILGPKILGNSTGLSSFMVIVAILLFGGLFGIVGMFVGVPVCAVIYTMLKTRRDMRLKNRSLSSDVADYEGMDFIDLTTMKPVPYTKESMEEQRTYTISPKKLRKDREREEEENPWISIYPSKEKSSSKDKKEKGKDEL